MAKRTTHILFPFPFSQLIIDPFFCSSSRRRADFYFFCSTERRRGVGCTLQVFPCPVLAWKQKERIEGRNPAIACTDDNNNIIITSAMDNGINAKMRKRVPELKSEYAAYPMNYEGNWPKPPATAPDGNKLFVKSPPAPKGEAKELKDDYVWGPGTYGFGYYHLLTKDAYKILEARLAVDSAPTVGCGGCFGKGSSGADEYDPERRSDLKEIHHIVYFRSQ